MKSSETYDIQMISEGVQVHSFGQNRLIYEANFGVDPLLKRFLLLRVY